MTTNEKDPQTILRNAMESFLSDALEALMLMVEEEVAKARHEPEPEPIRPDLPPDDTPVGHGLVVDEGDLFRHEGGGWFTFWLSSLSKWGSSGAWREEELTNAQPATVGDLRRVGLPISEWPGIEMREGE